MSLSEEKTLLDLLMINVKYIRPRWHRKGTAWLKNPMQLPVYLGEKKTNDDVDECKWEKENTVYITLCTCG